MIISSAMAHLIPLLEGGLIFLMLEFFLFKPAVWIFIIIGITALIGLGILILKKRFLNWREFLHYFCNPAIFVWSAGLLLLFFENFYFRHFFVFGVGIYIFFYFENLFYYLVSGKGKNAENFLRITNLMNVVSVFFLAAGLYGVKTFIQLPIWLVSMIFFALASILIYGALGVIKSEFREIVFDIFTVSLIITEFFVILNFLPIGFYAGGALLGIVYYIIAGILINFLKKGIAPYKRYVIIGGILLFLVILTAKWV